MGFMLAMELEETRYVTTPIKGVYISMCCEAYSYQISSVLFSACDPVKLLLKKLLVNGTLFQISHHNKVKWIKKK